MLQGILFCVLHYTTHIILLLIMTHTMLQIAWGGLYDKYNTNQYQRQNLWYVGYCRNLHYNCSKLSISAVTWTFSGARVILQNAACIAADCVQISKPSLWLYVWELYICYIWYHYIYEYRKIYQLCNLIVLVGMSHLRVFACDTYNVC